MNFSSDASGFARAVFKVALLTAFFAVAPTPARCLADDGIRPGIVGGEPAREGEFPFMVSLQEYGDHFCGGTLIAPSWVLTAAHCALDLKVFPEKLQDTEAVLGSLWIGDPTEGERHRIAAVWIHPGYVAETNDYDFALLKLERPSALAPLRPQVEPVGGELAGGVIATVAGWGATNENGVISMDLRKVLVPVVSQQWCSQAYPGKITERMLCAGFESGGKDSCHRDSGGPLILRAGTDRAVLAGVVSFGIGCARPGLYGVYGRVASVAGWIAELLAL